MKPTKLQWEDVIQFEEVEGYGKSIWRNEDKYYFVLEEGTVASWLVVYELPNELFALLESGERTLREISCKVKHDYWPPNVTQEEADRNFLRQYPEALRGNSKAQGLFTKAELKEMLPEGAEILASSD
ncbi:hypothetical protein [Streptococcus oralis]|uniref:hypothetical protein n=1 Tax=Streptococcus oralis TaxID=1303 RepID=UPI0002583E6E|nr:hypothetical protein [Streptococcus oralis]EIC78372.1 hypothetical protein HMPREF1114_0365 [Streptococcus oralis SK100]KZX08065.1 hypothetical protein A4224_06050 [Streptococcus oralis]